MIVVFVSCGQCGERDEPAGALRHVLPQRRERLAGAISKPFIQDDQSDSLVSSGHEAVSLVSPMLGVSLTPCLCVGLAGEPLDDGVDAGAEPVPPRVQRRQGAQEGPAHGGRPRLLPRHHRTSHLFDSLSLSG